MTIEVNGKETDTFVNEVEKGSILITKTGLEGTDTAKLSLYFDNDTPGDDTDDVLISVSPQTVSNISPTASWTNLDFGTYYVVESFAGITNTKTYEVKDPLTIEVNGEETDTF